MSLRRRVLFVALAVACLTAASCAVVASRRGPEGRDDGVVPVILVHGYGGTSGTMRTLQTRLEGAGHQVVAVDLPFAGIDDIEASAETVAAAVKATGAPEVDLVGFSAGGVVARAYVDSLERDERPRVVVTLGSPHHGTEIAGAAAAAGTACTDACEQLAPGSAFLAELNEPDETPPGPDYVSVWTAFDQTVTPPESAVLDGAVNVRLQDVCPRSAAGHIDLLSDPLAVGLVLRALTGDLDSPPGREWCGPLRALGATARGSRRAG